MDSETVAEETRSNGVPANPATGPMPDLTGAGGAEGIDQPTEPGEQPGPEPDPAEAAIGTQVEVDGQTFDIADLTLDEVEELERRCGDLAFGEIDYTRAANLKVLCMLFKRRGQPDFTLEDAGKLPLGVLMAGRQADQEGDTAEEGRPTAAPAGAE